MKFKNGFNHKIKIELNCKVKDLIYSLTMIISLILKMGYNKKISVITLLKVFRA